MTAQVVAFKRPHASMSIPDLWTALSQADADEQRGMDAFDRATGTNAAQFAQSVTFDARREQDALIAELRARFRAFTGGVPLSALADRIWQMGDA